jgi:hypothetical protein
VLSKSLPGGGPSHRSSLFRIPGVTIVPTLQPRILFIEAGLSRESAVKVLQILEKNGFGELQRLVYHTCSDAPVVFCALKTRKGIPRICPECDRPLLAKDIRFDLVLDKPGDRIMVCVKPIKINEWRQLIARIKGDPIGIAVSIVAGLSIAAIAAVLTIKVLDLVIKELLSK